MQFEKENKRLKKVIIALCLVAVAAGVALCAVFRIPMRIENYGEDYLYRKLDGITEDIKIIAIDDESLNVLGPYSYWNRNYFAKLIEILNEDEENRPEVIGIDVIFSGTNDSEEDAALTEAVSKAGNVVLASSLESDRELVSRDGIYYTRTYISKEHTPFKELAEAAEYGFTNVITDGDGIVRTAYTQIPPSYKSFAYVIASRLSELPEYDTREELAYSMKPGEVEAVSMAKVLDGSVPASHFAGSIVLVGAYTGGMLDSYKVPCDYSREMYGVEIQANYIEALLHNKTNSAVPAYLVFPLIGILMVVFAVLLLKSQVKKSAVLLAVFMAGYVIAAAAVFGIFSYKLPLTAVLAGFFLLFILSLLYKYTELLKRRQRDTQRMLFSMAEAFAEAIEGRTPYNANHTKNVAKRCMEMLDHINELHKEKKTELSFSESDRKQLYLAAMLHDIGKMDVPLEVMDKPTKLGSREERLKDRLKIIMLKLENDILSDKRDRVAAEKEIEKIKKFLDNIAAFNCGRPLSDEEWKIIADMEDGCYTEEDGSSIPYLTEDEKADLHIERGTLSEEERTIMQSHVVYTDKILSHMVFGDEYRDVRAMAANHHELLNGKGYPKKLDKKDLDVMTRILTVMDIYDSLIADDRPYKKPKSVEAAFEIMDEEAEAGKIDKEMLKYAKELYLTGQEKT
ncbi:MAG: CHASE2 domain-containing protein [Lachnospiraceae bacterium]|nr:CHASE2 domain-containing protein [Lachnospiraceae bacterium]